MDILFLNTEWVSLVVCETHKESHVCVFSLLWSIGKYHTEKGYEYHEYQSTDVCKVVATDNLRRLGQNEDK